MEGTPSHVPKPEHFYKTKKMKNQLENIVFLLITSSLLLRCSANLCSTSSDCNSTSSFCHFPDGVCGSGDGYCDTIPEVCSQEHNPVCGCDKNTYTNMCDAFSVGISVNYEGPCKSQTQCTNDTQCGSEEYCNFGGVECSGFGTCEGVPSICTLQYDPVCGCDGEVYNNNCDAASNGVSSTDVKNCSNSCSQDIDCQGKNTFCEYELGSCKPPGKCVEIPELCPELYDPVCGCDGRTFSNLCYSSVASQSISVSTSCEQKKSVRIF